MKKENFFEADLQKLKLDTTIPFDCFVENEVTGEIVHWLKQNFQFTNQRLEKLQKLGVSRIWVMHIQRPEYLKYIGGKTISPDSDLILVKDRSAPQNKYLIFGRSKTSAKTIIVGLPKEKAGEIISKPKTTVDAEFINIVIESTVQAFAEQFGITATSKPPTRRTGTSEPSEIDVASFVGLTSQTIRGTVGLCFPANTYFFLLKQATGLEIIEASTENCTGCAELMHSIFEIARPKLHKTGYPIDQAIPAFVIGKQLPVSKIIPDRGFTIVFETPGGPFQFEIGIKTGT